MIPVFDLAARVLGLLLGRRPALRREIGRVGRQRPFPGGERLPHEQLAYLLQLLGAVQRLVGLQQLLPDLLDAAALPVILLCPSQLIRRSPEVPGRDEVQMLSASLGVAGCRGLELALQRLGAGGRGACQQDEQAADQSGRSADEGAVRDLRRHGSHRRRPPAGETSIDRAMTSSTI